MTFAGKPNDNNNQPKRRSLIVEAFNPHIGASIRPVRQSFNLIVNLIAMIFASQGLFPRNHPALSGEPGTSKLRLQDVFATAWGNLSFTKEGLPKVLIFFAVIASVIISIFGVFSVLMSLMMGTAHAQGCPAQGCFTPANTTNDLGYNLINFLFGTAADQSTAYTNINGVYSQFAGGTLPNNNIQTALATGLGLYSSAMLIFAAIVLFYHLASMVVDTAHSGVTMGKRANQVWAPIRLVAAVVLLVPISGGLNSGQLIVLKMAQWGGGLASNVWDGFKTQFATVSQSGTAAQGGGQLAVPAVAEVTDLVVNIAKMSACTYAYNYNQYAAAQGDPSLYDPNQFVNGWTNNWSATAAWVNNTPDVPGTAEPGATTTNLVETRPNGDKIYHFQTPTPDADSAGADLCGNYTIPAEPNLPDGTQQTVADNIWKAQQNTFNTYLPQIMQYGTNVLQYIQGTGNAATQGNLNPDTSGTSLMTLIYNYQNALNTAVASAVTSNAALTDKYLGVGWMGAGAFFNQVSNVQAVAQSAASNYMPASQAPSGEVNIGSFATNIQNSFQKQNTTTLPQVNLPGGGGCPATAANFWGGLAAAGKELVKVNIINAIFELVNTAANTAGVWCPDGTLGIRFTGSAPLNQMAAWGHQNIDLSVGLMNSAAWLMFAGAMAEGDTIGRAEAGVIGGVGGAAAGLAAAGSWLANKVGWKSGSKNMSQAATNIAAGPTVAFLMAALFGGGAATIGQLLLPFAAIFMTLGFTFGYMLPMLPFMHFLFGCVSWLALLFEAVIAMPLVALAHINPEGEGLPGGMAKTAYFMAFSILLRPVLMIFGLIAGFITLMLATSLLNIFFAHAVTGNTPGGHEALIRLIYTVIYSVILISIANHAFQLITVIPDKIMSWIGTSGARGERMGDPGSIARDSAAAVAIVDQKGIQQLGSAGQTFRSFIKEGVADREKQEGLTTAAARHNELASASSLSGQRLGHIANTISRVEGNTAQTATNTGQTATNTAQTATNTQQIPDIKTNTDRIP